MERIDAGAEEFEEVEIAGTAGLFTDLWVDKATVPEGGIDAAVKKMAGRIKAGEDLLPDVSPALKKNGGRSR